MKHVTTAMLLSLVTPIAFAQTNTFPSSGNVGINTTSPTFPLDVNGRVRLRSVGLNNTPGMWFDKIYTPNAQNGFIGTFNDSTIGFFGGGNWKFFFDHVNNFQGINNSAPKAPLSFSNATGNKLDIFYASANSRYGIGLQGSLMQLYSGTAADAIAFGYGSSTAFTERMRIKGNGNVGIGTSTPEGKLDVRGGDVYLNTIRAGMGGGNTHYCTAFGFGALDSNKVNGWCNTAIGHSSLHNNTTGGYNTAVGYYSLITNITGRDNTAVGYYSLFANTTGERNTSIGMASLSQNSAGSFNTALGGESLELNMIGNYNTAVGYFSSNRNISGSNNTSMGYNSMYLNNDGNENCAVGNYAMYNSISGNWNTATGRYALYNNTTGNENTAIGDVALYNNTTGGFNTGIGYLATPNTGGLSNTTALGYTATTTASNQVRIGNSSVTSIGGYANWTNISDGRVKKNIKENVPGLVFINQLKAVTYNLDLAAADKITNKTPIKDEGKKENESPELLAAKNTKEQVVYTGFIAQDVEKEAKKLGYDFSGVDAPKNDNDLYGIRYAEFVVPLVKAVQELAEENEQLKTAFREENEKLKAEINEIKAMLKTRNTVAAAATGSLEQNIPNPSGYATVINYTLPQQYVSAAIVITDQVGNKIKNISLTGTGKGNIVFNTNGLKAGSYPYSLYINNALVETKQLLIAK